MPKEGIHGGPILCQARPDGKSNSNQCYQPSAANSLNISVEDRLLSSITLAGSPLILFPAYPTLSGITRAVTITNNSTELTATNVAAALPADWSDVTQDASNCLSIAPGASCVLSFTPGVLTHEPIIVPVSGSNTSTVNLSLAVNHPWVANGQVVVVLPDPANNLIYLGGTFTYIGPNTGNGVPLNESNAQPLPSFPPVNGTINAVAADGSGGWYIGGSFSQVGYTVISRMAHILFDYTVDPNFNPSPNNAVGTIALNGSTLYVGGSFAALDLTNGLATAWNPNASSTVLSLAIGGGLVYAGGAFTSIGGQARNRIAALDAASGV